MIFKLIGRKKIPAVWPFFTQMAVHFVRTFAKKPATYITFYFTINKSGLSITITVTDCP